MKALPAAAFAIALLTAATAHATPLVELMATTGTQSTLAGTASSGTSAARKVRRAVKRHLATRKDSWDRATGGAAPAKRAGGSWASATDTRTSRASGSGWGAKPQARAARAGGKGWGTKPAPRQRGNAAGWATAERRAKPAAGGCWAKAETGKRAAVRTAWAKADDARARN